MPPIGRYLQRYQGLVDGDGAKDSALYFDQHGIVVDAFGRAAGSPAFRVRGINPTTNAPTEVFRVNKDGSVTWTGTPISVLNYGAKADGATDDGPAFNLALAAACAAGGGVVYVPAGTYKITTQVVIPCDGITLAGDGIGRTVLKDGATFATGIVNATGRSSLTLRDMTIQPQSAFGSYGFYVEGGASQITDILVQNVFVDQLAAAGSGAVITGAAGGMRRVQVRGVHVRSPAGGTGTFGLSLSAGNNGVSSYEAVVSGCIFDGFDAAFRQNTPGVWQEGLKVSDCLFKNAKRHGAYMYHCGRTELVNNEFRSNDAGLFLTDGASNQGGRVANCRFYGNTTIGMWGESFGYGGISGCSFDANGYGLWITAGLEWAVTGCTMTNNTRDGVLVDRHASIVSIADGGYTFSPVTVDAVQSVAVAGCVIASNSRNGVSVRGVQKGFTISGSLIVLNGQADNPTPTNYADVDIRADTDGANNYLVALTGCTIGNVAGTGTYTGYTKTGVLVASGTITALVITGCHIEGLNTPLNIPTATLCTVVGCTFLGCTNNIALPSGYVWRANAISGGTLANQVEATAGDLTVAGDLIQTGGNGARIDLLSGAFQGLRLGSSADVTTSNYTLAGDTNGATLLNALTGQTVNVRVANADVLTIGAASVALTSARLQEKRGANVNSANNMTLGTDGNCFQIAGTTQINLLDSSSWQDGSVTTLVFLASVTVKHNQAASGNFKPIRLNGAVDFAATADDTLTLRLVGAIWYEQARAVT